MKSVHRRVALALLFAAMLLLAGLWAALEPQAAVRLGPNPEPEDVARALAVVRSVDPRRRPPRVPLGVQLNERDIDVLLNHAARRWLGKAAVRVGIVDKAATVDASLQLKALPFEPWLNLHTRWRQGTPQRSGLPELASVRLGRLPLPLPLARWLGLRLADRAGLGTELQMAGEVVQRVQFQPDRLWMVMAWRDDSRRRIFDALLPPGEQQRLRAHADRLAAVVAELGPVDTVSLAPLIGPLFELARERTARGADPVAENRAALLVLALFVNGRSIDRLWEPVPPNPQAHALHVTLSGRDDFPRHLLVSAALALEGTAPLSRAVGLYKEILDAREGSGFSFNDMAANRAGTRLGELAEDQPARLQALLAKGVKEADLMPPWADLPEFMPEAEFQRRFGGVGAAPYLAVMADIEGRVAALPLQQALAPR